MASHYCGGDHNPKTVSSNFGLGMAWRRITFLAFPTCSGLSVLLPLPDGS